MRRRMPVSRSAVRKAVSRFMVEPRGTAGAALVEFVILAPILIVILTFLGDIGIMAYRQIEVRQAAQAGIQYAIDNASTYLSSPTSAASAASSAVTHATPWSPPIIVASTPNPFCGCPSSSSVLLLCTGACTSSCTATCANTRGTYVTVSAQATFTSLFATSHTITSSGTVRIQ
jgi:Flp pilus assembly protein TadG